MTTDYELLTLAAKAVPDLEFKVDESGLPSVFNGYSRVYWNPLTDDGAALGLAIRLKLEIYHYDVEGGSFVAVGPFGLIGPHEILPHDDDPAAATRRAIVRAAAEIGRSLP